MENRPKLDNLEEVRTYVAIVERGSLARAAAALDITPNAVSRRLAVLEQRLARRLIHRTTRRLAVTDEGMALYRRCRRALDELEEGERELVGADGLDGTLRVALHPGVIGTMLVQCLAQLLAKTGRLRLQIRVVAGPADPIRDRLDVALHLGKPAPSTLVAISLPMVKWSLAAAPAYVERAGRPRRPADLARHECLRLLGEGTETHWKLSREGHRPQRVAIGGRFESDDGSLLAAALYGGLGIGIRPSAEIDAGEREGTLTPILAGWHWASAPLWALVPPGRQRLPAVRHLLEVLRHSAKA